MKKITILVMAAILCCMTACEKNEPAAPRNAQAVDLGLSVKWANMNIGANTPEGPGDGFDWGETSPELRGQDWSTYKWCEGSSFTMTKYCTSSSYGTVDGKTTLDLEDDAAHVNWGGNWRMPTYDELNELKTQCTWTWTTLNGVKGYQVTGKNGNSIFLPSGDRTFYWSSSLDLDHSNYAYQLVVDKYFVSWNASYRYYSDYIRAVLP